MSVTVVSDPPLTEAKFSDLMSSAYFEEDGTTYCKDGYSITVDSPDPLPNWISLDGIEFTVTSDSPLNDGASQTVTVTLTIDDAATSSDSFDAELVCDPNTACDPSFRVPSSLDPVDCDNDGALKLENFQTGVTGDNIEYDEWYVPIKNYILSKVVIYKQYAVTSGFEVTYTPDNDSLENWPDLTHVFGYTELEEEKETFDIVNSDGEKAEVKELEFCMKYGFKGMRLTLYNGQIITINNDDCTDEYWKTPVGLDRRRLIGFKV